MNNTTAFLIQAHSLLNTWEYKNWVVLYEQEVEARRRGFEGLADRLLEAANVRYYEQEESLGFQVEDTPDWVINRDNEPETDDCFYDETPEERDAEWDRLFKDEERDWQLTDLRAGRY